MKLTQCSTDIWMKCLLYKCQFLPLSQFCLRDSHSKKYYNKIFKWKSEIGKLEEWNVQCEVSLSFSLILPEGKNMMERYGTKPRNDTARFFLFFSTSFREIIAYTFKISNGKVPRAFVLFQLRKKTSPQVLYFPFRAKNLALSPQRQHSKGTELLRSEASGSRCRHPKRRRKNIN